MKTFAQRLIGATVLDRATYEEVEADRGGTGQAMAVVLLSALAAGIGARGLGGPISLAPFVGIVALLAWAAWALLTFEIGTRLLPEPGTRADVNELLRTIGFASAPGLLRIIGIVPAFAMPAFVLSAIWMLAAMVVAVRQALDYRSTARAFAVCVLGWALTIAFVVVLGLFASPLAAQEGTSNPQAPLVLDIVRGGSVNQQRCEIVKREPTGGGTERLTLATPVHGFVGPANTPLPSPEALRLHLGGGRVVDMRIEEVVAPAAGLPDVALLKVTARSNVALPVATREFTVAPREVGGPLVTVAFGEEKGGTVDVPFAVKSGEAVIDATATVTRKGSLALADVSVLRVGDRAVTLRFSLAGNPPPAVQPPSVPCPPAQALVSVSLDVLSRRVR